MSDRIFAVNVEDFDGKQWGFKVRAVCHREASRQADNRIKQMMGSGMKPPKSWKVEEKNDETN